MKPDPIHLWSHSENYKWAKELAQILGNKHPKTIAQFEASNKILAEIKNKCPEYFAN